MIFLEDLLTDMIAKKSKDPFGTIRVARKALSKIRFVSHCFCPSYTCVVQLVMLIMFSAFTESCREGSLHRMEKHSSDQPAARHLQLQQKPG